MTTSTAHMYWRGIADAQHATYVTPTDRPRTTIHSTSLPHIQQLAKMYRRMIHKHASDHYSVRLLTHLPKADHSLTYYRGVIETIGRIHPHSHRLILTSTNLEDILAHLTYFYDFTLPNPRHPNKNSYSQRCMFTKQLTKDFLTKLQGEPHNPDSPLWKYAYK